MASTLVWLPIQAISPLGLGGAAMHIDARTGIGSGCENRSSRNCRLPICNPTAWRQQIGLSQTMSRPISGFYF